MTPPEERDIMQHDTIRTDDTIPQDDGRRSVLVIRENPPGWWVESATGDIHRELVALRPFFEQVCYPALDTPPLLPVREPGRWYFSVGEDGNAEIGGPAPEAP